MALGFTLPQDNGNISASISIKPGLGGRPHAPAPCGGSFLEKRWATPRHVQSRHVIPGPVQDYRIDFRVVAARHSIATAMMKAGAEASLGSSSVSKVMNAGCPLAKAMHPLTMTV